MEKLTMDEQDITNAICLHIAKQYSVNPEAVEVELAYDDDEGFSAEAYFDGKKQDLAELQMIQAIRLWIEVVLEEDPSSAGIKLELDPDEGITAFLS